MTSATNTVLGTILKWSEKRPLWQRDALRRIVLNGTPDKNVINELLLLCKQEHGGENSGLEPQPLEQRHLPANPEKSESISLTGIKNVVGVNQLAPNQDLKFEPSGLTIIYGSNGSGKSGYARILKRACRSRHAGEIMPDIYDDNPPESASAEISIKKNDGSLTLVNWLDGEPKSDDLSAITVFDRDSASVHLRIKNDIWFRPFGLDIPDDLAGVSKALQAELNSEKESIEAARSEAFHNPFWSVSSTLGALLNGLKNDTDINAYRSQQPFSDQDEARLQELQKDLNQDPKKAAQEQNQTANRIRGMLETMEGLETALSHEEVSKILEAEKQANLARQVADKAAKDAFGDLKIDGVGTPVWKGLWESAKAYSDSLKKTTQPFPPKTGDTCVLCHQTIGPEVASRMDGFESFVRADTETKATAAAKRSAEEIQKLVNLRIDMRLLAPARKLLKEKQPETARAVLRFLASARLRRLKILRSIETKSEMQIPSLAPLQKEKIESIIAEITKYAASLLSTDDASSRAALEEERNELVDRKQEDALLSIASTEIQRLKKLTLIEKCLGDMTTTKITNLGNKIADELITPTMRDQFHNEIVDLVANRVNVEVVRSGGNYGSPKYEVRFLRKPKAKVGDVLSEGEQTCVALASYLTELANASHNSALVFDDPVSSLDHRWRSKVARRLAKEALTRQVIVFTHDLIFVNDLDELAAEQSVPVKHAHLTRGSQGVGIVNDNLPWRASGVPDRIDKLEKSARAAKVHFDNGEEESYRAATLDIYDELRAAWERGLEDIVFAGVLLRHRDYIKPTHLNKVIVLDQNDVDIFKSGFEKCCDYINSHDPSRGRDAEPPDPTELMQDITCLRDWAKTLKDKHNAL